MTLPAAHGLFHRVILESNSGTRVGHSLTRAGEMARDYMHAAGVTSIEQLRKLDWRELRDAQQRYFESAFGDSTFGPTWDGVVITEPPMKTILAGRAASIPVLLGTNLDEVRYWTEIEELPLQSKSEAKLREQVAAFAGSASGGIVDTYLRLNGNPGDAIVQLETDALWRMAAIRSAEALCERQPVYMYLFTYRSTAHHASTAPRMRWKCPSYWRDRRAGCDRVHRSGANRTRCGMACNERGCGLRARARLERRVSPGPGMRCRSAPPWNGARDPGRE